MYLTPGFVKHHNITHVINCAFDVDSPKWFRERNPENYTCIEALDSLNEDIRKWYPEFESAVNSYLRSPTVGNIYIHCQCGINRSGFLALLFVCKKFNYSFKLASDTILKQRPCALTNSTYKQQVIEYITNK
jgi:protein-tyrosine phosphatase